MLQLTPVIDVQGHDAISVTALSMNPAHRPRAHPVAPVREDNGVIYRVGTSSSVSTIIAVAEGMTMMFVRRNPVAMFPNQQATNGAVITCAAMLTAMISHSQRPALPIAVLAILMHLPCRPTVLGLFMLLRASGMLPIMGGAMRTMPATARNESWNPMSHRAAGEAMSIISIAAAMIFSWCCRRPVAEAIWWSESMMAALTTDTGMPTITT